ncbi:DgyrCDS9657 [Dimorphilus gyrociliatus]|uniref:DgyrCDS9657 n=1 Tax=Dimorphilus gyrociliatus TaxID=2664684 RepID=A0A7I8W0B9_9ANNE|nr:DgyrCDS9657 [Dimorphilus gyrociliatus]
MSDNIITGKLINMGWTLGMTTSSNHCRSVNKPFVILTLTIDQDDYPIRKTVELELEQFLQLSKQLKNAHNSEFLYDKIKIFPLLANK